MRCRYNIKPITRRVKTLIRKNWFSCALKDMHMIKCSISSTAISIFSQIQLGNLIDNLLMTSNVLLTQFYEHYWWNIYNEIYWNYVIYLLYLLAFPVYLLTTCVCYEEVTEDIGCLSFQALELFKRRLVFQF